MAGEDWPLVPLGELTENFDGRRVPVKELERKPGPYPYYGASGIVDRVDGYLFDGEYLLIGEDGENLRTRQTPIAFMATGKFWVNNHAHIVRGNRRADTRYLSYVLSQTDISGYLTGSTMPKLTQGNLNRLPVIAPPLAEQKAIAAVLGALDDKIELNRRMNATLEAMARALFQSWFVDFDPIRAKLDGRKPIGMDDATAALFPASFQDSLLGPIPKGWEVSTIEDVCKTVTRGVTPEYQEGSGRFIINQRVNRGSDLDWSSLKELSPSLDVPPDRYAKCWDVLVNCLGEGTLGRTHLYKGESDVYAIDQHMSICRADSPSRNAYIYQVLSSVDGQAKIETLKTGSTGMTMFNISKLRAYDLVWPSDKVLETYFATVEPLWFQVAINENQSRTLATLRDTLLPKLLSGELKV
jgi:type I restriction enzyme S subunit